MAMHKTSKCCSKPLLSQTNKGQWYD